MNRDDSPARPEDRLTVAIVDDDARVRRALANLVRSAPDLEVVGEAGTPREALLNDAQHAAHVVILDMLLPAAGDGLDVLRALIQRGRRVIAISSFGSLRRQAMEAGAYAFIEKGGREFDDLHEAIRAAARPP